MTRLDLARKLLKLNGLPVPDDEVELRQAAYEAFEDEDFIQAHMFRLDKERQDFTREDWESILELSGREMVESNIAAFVACTSHGLLN